MPTFMPQNLSLLGRAAVLVVGIELLTSTIGLITSVSQLVHYFQATKNETHVEVADSKTETDAQSIDALGFLVFFFSIVFIFDILLYVGIRKGKTTFLAFWYAVNVVAVFLVGLVAIITAISGEYTNIGTPGIVIRIFEIWVIHEYCSELELGYVPQQNDAP